MARIGLLPRATFGKNEGLTPVTTRSNVRAPAPCSEFTGGCPLAPNWFKACAGVDTFTARIEEKLAKLMTFPCSTEFPPQSEAKHVPARLSPLLECRYILK